MCVFIHAYVINMIVKLINSGSKTNEQRNGPFEQKKKKVTITEKVVKNSNNDISY